jgi:hypothetical protein
MHVSDIVRIRPYTQQKAPFRVPLLYVYVLYAYVCVCVCAIMHTHVRAYQQQMRTHA